MKSIITLALSAFVFFSFVLQTGDCKTIPANNQKIMAFLNKNMNKKLGKYGPCYEWAELAYKAAGLEFEYYNLGEKVDHTKDCIFPGDLILLDGVELKFKRNDTTYTQRYPNAHYFFVHKVKSQGVYVVVNQRDTESKMRVMPQPFDVKEVTNGKPVFYRPVKK